VTKPAPFHNKIAHKLHGTMMETSVVILTAKTVVPPLSNNVKSTRITMIKANPPSLSGGTTTLTVKIATEVDSSLAVPRWFQSSSIRGNPTINRKRKRGIQENIGSGNIRLIVVLSF
jgi:hypothetical protein